MGTHTDVELTGTCVQQTIGFGDGKDLTHWTPLAKRALCLL